VRERELANNGIVGSCVDQGPTTSTFILKHLFFV